MLADVLTGGKWDTPIRLIVWEGTALSIFIYSELRIDYAVRTLSKSRNRAVEKRGQGESVVSVGRVMPPGPTYAAWTEPV